MTAKKTAKKTAKDKLVVYEFRNECIICLKSSESKMLKAWDLNLDEWQRTEAVESVTISAGMRLRKLL